MTQIIPFRVKIIYLVQLIRSRIPWWAKLYSILSRASEDFNSLWRQRRRQRRQWRRRRQRRWRHRRFNGFVIVIVITVIMSAASGWHRCRRAKSSEKSKTCFELDCILKPTLQVMQKKKLYIFLFTLFYFLFLSYFLFLQFYSYNFFFSVNTDKMLINKIVSSKSGWMRSLAFLPNLLAKFKL